jgi:hypothetical protein
VKGCHASATNSSLLRAFLRGGQTDGHLQIGELGAPVSLRLLRHPLEIPSDHAVQQLKKTSPIMEGRSKAGPAAKARKPSSPGKARPSGKRKKHQPLLEVRESGVHGRGVYALSRIPKGKRIIEYTGKVLPWEEASEQLDGPHTFLFGLTNGRDVIDPEIGGNEARWINHSCSPNCQAFEEGNRVFIYARRAIPPGEELFYDYGLEVDEPRTKKLEREYACHCGSRKCRGTMLGN